MDPHNWQKTTNNSPTSFRSHLKSETHRKRNRVHVTTTSRDKDIIRTNIQENICIFNQIRHIQAIGNKLISLFTKPPTPVNIVDVVKTPLISEWYDSFFSNYKKMATFPKFSAPFLRYLLPPNKNTLRPRIYFRVRTTDIENQYHI